jgi:nucleoside-diphosphate-sugar epimerase
MKILVTGGGGYKGSILVNKLLGLDKVKKVLVIDTFWFGNYLKPNNKLKIIKKNILDVNINDLKGIDHIIHLAAIANDPASDLNVKLTWEYSCLGTMNLCEIAKKSKIKKFIFASSGSVYGIKKEKKVTENLDLKPISDYNKTKMITEKMLLSYNKFFKIFIIRPGTVYGYSPRMRLDLTLNILTFSALKNNKIEVFGGKQIRPMIHIDDITDIYLHFLLKKVNEGVYNAANINISIYNLAKQIKKLIGKKIDIKIHKSNDPRSYRLNSDKILKTGFSFKKNILDGINEIKYFYEKKLIKNEKKNYSINWIKKYEKN